MRIARDMHTALKHEHESVAVSNNSWGFLARYPHSNREVIEEGVMKGITDGFYGKGTLYVFAASTLKNSNMSSLESFYAILPVCFVAEDGTGFNIGNNPGSYGDNLWICAPQSVYAPSGYTEYGKYGGLSSATATVSGVAALVRGVNADLTWRDVKLLLAGSARQNDADHSEWASGAAKYGNPTSKYQFNPNYGFGLVDAGAAVALAQNWVNLPPMATSVVEGDPIKIPDRASGDAEVVERTFRVENDGLTTPTFIEHVEVRMGIRHGAANDLSVDLVSPSGVVSKLLWHEPGAIRQGVIFTAYALGSSRYLGENPTGEWTLRVADHVSGDSGSIHSLSLVVRGHRPNNSQATGLPTIGGTAQVDYTLTADTSAIADEDGMTNAVFSYQWIAGETDISGATGSSYTLTSGEVGQIIKVMVSYTDDAGNLEHLTSAPTDPVRLGLTISGIVQVDYTLTADTSPIADADGMTNAVFSYQWIAGETDISGATGSSYVLTSSEQGKTIRVTVSYTDDAGNLEHLTSAPTDPVRAGPTISGIVQVDYTLTADTSPIADADGMTNAVFSYQWIAGQADISDATDANYVLTSSEQGKTIKVTVSYTDDAGNLEHLTSAATDPVRAGPTISGTAQVDETLTADTSAIADGDGMTNAVFSYQWIAGQADISDATDANYVSRPVSRESPSG